MFFKDTLLTSVKKMMFLARDAEDNITHDGLLGRFKEIFLNELLEPYLGPFMKACTGIVIDSFGKQSKQIDIIIYDSEIIPPALLKKEAGVIPVESVLATIEVKSTLKAGTLKDAVLNGISVKELNFHPSVIKTITLHNIPSYLFAFKSDLKGKKKTEIERVVESIEKYGIGSKGDPYCAPISGVCVASKTFIYFSAFKENNPVKNMWYEFENVELYDEILKFILSIIDYCFIIKQERRRVSISHYIFK